MAQKKDKAPLYLGLFVAVVFIISTLVFLTSKESYNGQEISGWEVLGKQSAGFWAWVVIGFVGGAAGLYYAYKVYDGSGIGRNSTLSDGKLTVLVVLAVVLICSPWGKACTDKANGGFTLPKTEVKP